MKKVIYYLTQYFGDKNGDHDGYVRDRYDNREDALASFPSREDIKKEMRQERRNGGHFRWDDYYRYDIEMMEVDGDDCNEEFIDTIRSCQVTWDDCLPKMEDNEDEQD